MSAAATCGAPASIGQRPSTRPAYGETAAAGMTCAVKHSRQNRSVVRSVVLIPSRPRRNVGVGLGPSVPQSHADRPAHCDANFRGDTRRSLSRDRARNPGPLIGAHYPNVQPVANKIVAISSTDKQLLFDHINPPPIMLYRTAHHPGNHDTPAATDNLDYSTSIGRRRPVSRSRIGAVEAWGSRLRKVMGYHPSGPIPLIANGTRGA